MADRTPSSSGHGPNAAMCCKLECSGVDKQTAAFSLSATSPQTDKYMRWHSGNYCRGTRTQPAVTDRDSWRRAWTSRCTTDRHGYAATRAVSAPRCAAAEAVLASRRRTAVALAAHAASRSCVEPGSDPSRCCARAGQLDTDCDLGVVAWSLHPRVCR